MQKTNLIKITCGALCASLLTPAALLAAPPPTITYQGKVTVDGAAFDGTGDFQFALVDDGTENVRTAQATAVVHNGFVTEIIVNDGGHGYVEAPGVEITARGHVVAQAAAKVEDGQLVSISVTNAGDGTLPAANVSIDDPPPASIQTLWSHDGSSTGGGPPDTYVPLEVREGVFSLALGGAGMEPLSEGVFKDAPVFLRVWFDGGSGVEQLTPDAELTSVPFALRAAWAASLADGSLSSDAFAAGAVADALAAEGIHVPASSSSPLEFRLAHHPVLRVEPASVASELRPNVILGAPSNEVDGASVFGATVAGGSNNTAGGSEAVVSGGFNNVADGGFSSVGGGAGNRALATYSTVAGGDGNEADGSRSTVGGGEGNRADGNRSTVAGGDSNEASGSRAFVGGGSENVASGSSSVVPGGMDNVAEGALSFAAGRRAQADHTGTFVWSDSSVSPFTSTGNNQFLINAAGGVGINTNEPSGAFHVVGGHAAIGGFDADDRLGVGTDNPWNTLHVVSNDEQGPFRVAVGSNSNTAFRIYPNRATGIGGSWNENDIPERGLRVHGETHFGDKVGINTTEIRSNANFHIRNPGFGDNILLEGYTGTAWSMAALSTGRLSFSYGEDVAGSMSIRAYIETDGRYTRASDRRLKDDVRPLQNLLGRIRELEPVSYRMIRDDTGLNFGFIAQEVKSLFPAIVSGQDQEYLTLSYDTFAVLAIQAVREQQEIIEEQAAEIQGQAAEIAELREQLEVLAEAAARGEEMETRLARIEGWLESVELVSQ